MMNEKDSLELMAMVVQAEIRKECAYTARSKFFEQKRLNKIRTLIEQLNKVNKNLKNTRSI